MVKPVIFQVAGYQNSGKTTIVEKLIKASSRLGWKVVTIKHHGHGGKPEVIEDKDSSRHLLSGAQASLVEGNGRMVLQSEDIDLPIEAQIQIMSFLQPDIILLEGYKQEPFPKLLLLRDEEDFLLLDKVSNLQAIGYWKDEMLAPLMNRVDVPCYKIDDDVMIDHTIQHIKKFVHKIDEKTP